MYLALGTSYIRRAIEIFLRRLSGSWRRGAFHGQPLPDHIWSSIMATALNCQTVAHLSVVACNLGRLREECGYYLSPEQSRLLRQTCTQIVSDELDGDIGINQCTICQTLIAELHLDVPGGELCGKLTARLDRLIPR